MTTVEPNVLQHLIANLPPGVHKVEVSAVNAIGEGAASATQTFTVSSAQPSPLYERATFGAYYSVPLPGGFGDSINTPVDGSANYLFEKSLDVSLPRFVWYCDFSSGIPEGASYYSGKGYRFVRAWGGNEYLGPNYDTATAVPFSEILSGSRDAQLQAVFVAHAAYVGGTDFRMFWEMNLPSTVPAWTTTQQFIDTWRYIVTYARKNFPTADFRFMWVPNAGDGYFPAGVAQTGVAKMEYFWPGQGYVDVAGIDDYNNPAWGPWGLASAITPVYDRLTALVDNYPDGWDKGSGQTPVMSNMPIALGETGCLPGERGQTLDVWLTSLFMDTSMPRLSIIDFFNAGEWQLTTTPASTAVLKQYLPKLSAT